MPPGTYSLSFELAGFNVVKREGIQIGLGFTANIDVEIALAALQETVTVTGASPVIDTSSTRVQQNFKLEQLQSIPNARDMWSLLAVTPAVQMGRIDVGGNRAGTQTAYSAYGAEGELRLLLAQPRAAVAGAANPNTADKRVTYQWNVKATGTELSEASAILAPFTARVGLRLVW